MKGFAIVGDGKERWLWEKRRRENDVEARKVDYGPILTSPCAPGPMAVALATSPRHSL